MRLAKAGEVLKLTGLTADQLREWTARRGLIQPDAKPNGPGSRAGFSWQTILLLRVAIVLKDAFRVELQSQRDVFSALSRSFAKISFPSLRGTALILGAQGTFDILPLGNLDTLKEDLLIVRLDPHLDLLSTEFGFIEPMRQLPLFPALAVT